MYIKQDMDFNDLMNNCWSGAIDTLKTIEEHNKEEELMAHLEEIFESYFNNEPTMTEVNDYLWFEWETIFESLRISETEEEEERKQQEAEAEEARCFGYCDTLSPMAAGKARNALYKSVIYKDKAVKKKDFIKMLADNGSYTAQEKFFANYKNGKSPCYCIVHKDESFYTVSKTEYNLFKFLTEKEV